MTELIEYGNLDSDLVLIQPVDDHSLGMIGNEIGLIRQMTGKDFRFIAVKVSNWNNDLSPWSAPAVFGKEDFGRGASDTLNVILNSCSDRSLSYYIGGYSLAALFSLWASYQTDVFAGVAAASPSMWFPGFTGYMNENRIKCGRVYLSLGDREEKTRNPCAVS